MSEVDAAKNAQNYLELLNTRDKLERSLESIITQDFKLQMENILLRKNSSGEGE